MQLEGFLDYSAVLRAGVYALCWHGEVVYIGQSKQMFARIYTHRNRYNKERKTAFVPDWMPVKGVRFDAVFIRPCLVDDLDVLEREMIARYRPKHNIRLVPPVQVAMTAIANQLKAEGSVGVLRRI